MNEATLPPSPNWYLSSILACSKDGTVAWGARNAIIIAKRQENCKVLQYSIISHAHTDRVTTIAFSPEFGNEDKNLLVSGGDEHIVRVWNLDNLSAVLSYSYTDIKQNVIAVDWSKKDPRLICCLTSEGSLVAWNIAFNTANSVPLGKLTATCLSCCPHNSNIVAVGSRSGLIYIVDIVGSGKIMFKLRGHDAEIVSLSWCPVNADIYNTEGNKNSLLASGAKDRSIFIWKADGDGRYHTEITLPVGPIDSHHHRTKLNAAIGNWTAVCWAEPTLLLSCSSWGELISWDLTMGLKSKPPYKLIHSCHTRGLFSIAVVPNSSQESSENWRIRNSTTVWTLAQDRQVVCCNINTDNIALEYVIPTQGGYVYCIAACPLDTSRIAFGVGDAMLRLWNLSEPHESSFDIVSLWQKIKGKVRAISWHPEKENLLAYGTGEGRIGVFDTNGNKPPILYRQYHRNTVYTLDWGPNPSSKEFALYSCAEGELVYFNPAQPNQEPTCVLKKDCTEFSWKPDLSCLAVGFVNGSIVFYNNNLQECGRTIYPLKKALHCLTWHPKSTATDLSLSELRNCLAVAADATTILVFNFTGVSANSILSHETAAESSDDIKETDLYNQQRVIATLNGHVEKIVCLAWSPHFSGHLISGSYDSTAQVWNVERQELMGTFTKHCGPVLCCMWSPLNPDFIITGSADFTVHIWKLSEQDVILPTEKVTVKKAKSKKNKKKSQKNKINKVNDTASVSSITEDISLSLSEVSISNSCSTDGKKSLTKDIALNHSNNQLQLPKIEKSSILDSIKELIRDARDETDEELHTVTPSLFSTEENLRAFVVGKKSKLAAQGKYDQISEIDMWCNNFRETLEEATKQKRLNDFLVSLACNLSMKTWIETCEAYANQLVSDGQYQKAVSYLLCVHKNLEAVQIFINAKLYKEAYLLARYKFDPSDSVLEFILQNWAAHETSMGNFEQAAQCYIKLKQYAEAAKLLARRNDVACLEIAAELAFLSADNVSCKSLAEQAITRALINSSCETARSLIAKFPEIKYCEVHVNIFEEIQKCLKKEDVQKDIFLWLKGQLNYGLLKTAGSIAKSNNISYTDLCQNNFININADNNAMLQVKISHEIALAVTCDTKEKELKHIATMLGTISQFEILHQKHSKNERNILIHILANLDSKHLQDKESIFAENPNGVSKSLRAYLCLGLLNWSVDDLKYEEFNECEEIIVELIEKLLEDVLDPETVKFWSTTNQLKKVEALVTSALGKTQDTAGNSDSKIEITSLVEELDKINNNRKKFIERRVCAPSPILAYSKASELNDKLQDENIKTKFSNLLSEKWTKAISQT